MAGLGDLDRRERSSHDRHRQLGRGKKDDVGALAIVTSLGIEIEGIGRAEAIEARRAFVRYGKGLHPARLNFADCFAYALAKARGVPLLFKGDDFAWTDIVPAWRP
jgi:uncharacterized protein with PIN domain